MTDTTYKRYELCYISQMGTKYYFVRFVNKSYRGSYDSNIMKALDVFFKRSTDDFLQAHNVLNDSKVFDTCVVCSEPFDSYEDFKDMYPEEFL